MEIWIPQASVTTPQRPPSMLVAHGFPHHSSVRLDLACVRSRHGGKAWVDCHDVVKGLPLHLCWRHLSLPQTHIQDPGDAVWVQWRNVP